MKKIITVKGPIEARKITGVYAHEHLALNLERVRGGDDSTYNDPFLLAKELEAAKKHGTNLFVDVTNGVMGRNVMVLEKVSEIAGVHVVASTGYYIDEYLAGSRNKTAEQMSTEIIREIELGLDGTHIRPGIIGEIGVSIDGPTPTEQLSLKAAAIASKKTDLAISVHTSMGKHGLEVARFLISEGVKPDKVIIGHMDLNSETSDAVSIMELGANIGFDTIGKDNYLSNKVRVENIIYLINRGFGKKIVISQDISRKSYMKSFGGTGYGYIHESFLPAVAKKVSKKIIKCITRDNALRILQV